MNIYSFISSLSYLRGRQKNRWTENIKEDIQKRGSNILQAVECVKDRNSGRRSSVHPVVGNLRVKTDGPKEEKRITMTSVVCNPLILTNHKLQCKKKTKTTDMYFAKWFVLFNQHKLANRLKSNLHDFEDVVHGSADAQAWPASAQWVHQVVEPGSRSDGHWQVGLSVGDGRASVDLQLEQADETFLDVDRPVFVSRVRLNFTHFALDQPEWTVTVTTVNVKSTGPRAITEVRQRRARLVLGWWPPGNSGCCRLCAARRRTWLGRWTCDQTGREFESRPPYCRVATLGKSFTRAQRRWSYDRMAL